MMNTEDMIRELDRMATGDSELRYIVIYKGRTVAMFLRRWEAEKFIEISGSHDYKLIFE